MPPVPGFDEHLTWLVRGATVLPGMVVWDELIPPEDALLYALWVAETPAMAQELGTRP